MGTGQTLLMAGFTGVDSFHTSLHFFLSYLQDIGDNKDAAFSLQPLIDHPSSYQCSQYDSTSPAT